MFQGAILCSQRLPSQGAYRSQGPFLPGRPHQHRVALGGMLASPESPTPAHQAHLLPLFHRQVGRAQGAHTTDDPSQDGVAEVLPDWVV